jgi:hypothetical protein
MCDRVWFLITECGLHSVYGSEMSAKSAAWDLRYKFKDIHVSATEVL